MIIAHVFKGKKTFDTLANMCPELYWTNWCHKTAKNTEK